MKRLLAVVGLALAAAVPMATPAAAQSQGWVVTNVNMRSGPGTEYPPILVVPAGAPVTVFGCLEGYGWCDVAFEDARGFVAGSLLSFEYQNVRRPVVEIGPQLALPIISFSLGNYWDSHYRSRPFYRDRDRWERRRVYSSPPPRYNRPPAYRPDRPVSRPDYRPDQRRDNRDYRRDERRSDRRDDASRRFQEQRQLQRQRPEFRPDAGRGSDRPPGISGGQTERDARRFNRQQRGPQPGE